MSRRAIVNLVLLTIAAIVLLLSHFRPVVVRDHYTVHSLPQIIVADGYCYVAWMKSLLFESGSHGFVPVTRKDDDYMLFATARWSSNDEEESTSHLWIRLWPWVFLWGVLTFRHLVRDRRRRTRIRKGLCIRCGYDMRGSSQRCPECGADRMAEAGG